jgi:class 3 adenylate cyclase
VWRADEFLGALVSIVSLEALSEFISKISAKTELTSFILTGGHEVIGHAFSGEKMRGSGREQPLPTLETMGDASLALFSLPAEYDLREARPEAEIEAKLVREGDRAVVFFYKDVFGFGPEAWTFGVYAPLAEVEKVFGSLPFALIVGLTILGAAVLLAILLSRTISSPLSRFAAVSGAVRQLEIGRAQPLDRTYLREINSAAAAYNAMLNALRWFEIYLPRQLVMRLMRQGATAVRSEEREVTVLFTDIVGFTAIASKLTAAELADLLNHHFELLAEAIEAEGGTIDKYIGDSVMAFWGAPEDQPDHAERAARAAAAAERALDADNNRRVAEGLRPIRIRAGLHSGAVIVGNIGAPGRVNYTLIGDTVNAAQRIEALGKAHMREDETAIVLIAGEGASRLGSGFDLEPLEELVLRGRSEPTKILRLTGVPGAQLS